MLFNLTNKVAVITGGAAGIGKSISDIFARQGATVIILDIDEEKGIPTVETINRDGGRAEFYRCDVSKQEQVEKVFDTISAKYKQLDILVNNAGIGLVSTVETTKEKDLDRIYNINIKGFYNCMRAAVGIMKSRKKGVILNMASMTSLIGVKNRFAYSMTKGAVCTMTLSVAIDYLEFNIRCNCVCPARIHTELQDNNIRNNYPGREKEIFEEWSHNQPIGRMGKPEEVAYLALYLCSDEAAFVTGSIYPIDGGTTKLVVK
jgi:2-keto-3-deoxy-L-fuconate dehydrogenase